MEKNVYKTWTWVLELAFLFLAFTAPLNPLITTKAGVYYWTFAMMGLGTIAILVQIFKGFPPEEYSLEGETKMGEIHREE